MIIGVCTGRLLGSVLGDNRGVYWVIIGECTG